MSDTELTIPPGEPVITMSRVFNAPRRVLWKAITEPAHLVHWWGPARFRTEIIEMDHNVGGAWRMVHHGEGGEAYVFFGEFIEILAPEKLVMTFNFEGAPPEAEPVTETHILEDLGERTRLSTTSRFARIEDRDGMVASGMESGARESWDRLAALVEKLAAA